MPSIYLVCVVFSTAIPTSLYIFGKCFSYLFVCLLLYHTTIQAGGCFSLSSAPTPLVCMYVSVFVEKGLSPSKPIDVIATWEVSVASKYDPADYSTVHHCESLLRFRFLLGSETQSCNLGGVPFGRKSLEQCRLVLRGA